MPRTVLPATAAAAAAVALLLAGLAVGLGSTAVTAAAAEGGGDGDRVARGEYLATRVAMCVQCHTPRNLRGELERSKLLQGAPIPVASPYPNEPWAYAAPRLAGLAPWTEEQIVTLLTTGARPTGERPRPPMPPFRLTREDAEAVVAYLESLR
jgi:mono/diheme cytochrome c family protein